MCGKDVSLSLGCCTRSGGLQALVGAPRVPPDDGGGVFNHLLQVLCPPRPTPTPMWADGLAGLHLSVMEYATRRFSFYLSL